MNDLLPLVPDEDRHHIDVDAAEILVEVLDLRPVEGWDDDDQYPYGEVA